jgi:hypothetical protein
MLSGEGDPFPTNILPEETMKLRSKLLLLTLLLPHLVFAVTLSVKQDGSGDYTAIQTAIDAACPGDTVLVYPGRYIENVTLNCHYITLASLYSTNPDQQIIENTVIDGNLGTCIKVYRCSYVTISGFTLVNNEDNLLNSPSNPGGGIFAEYASYTTIENTIIRNCIAQSGGGIAATRSSLSLSNVNIFNNQALNLGGGLAIERSSGLSMSSTNLCSIYNNHATRGMDISIIYPFTEYTLPIEIILDVGSTVLSEVEGYFIQVHNATDVSVNIAQGEIDQIDHDLYVAPDGDDNNSGTSPASPLKTIAIAMQRIASNPDNPKTIHLAPGLYSHSANGQILPMGVKSNVKVQGAGMGETIIDGELKRTFWGSWYASNVELSGMKLMNGRSIYAYVFCFFYGNNAYIHDIEFYNNYGSLLSGMIIAYSSDVRIENVIIGNVDYPNDIAAIWAAESYGVIINNVSVVSNSTGDSESNYVGFMFYDSDIVLRNSVVSNISAVDAWVFLYQNIYEPFSDYNLDMSNVLIINNTVTNPSWVNTPVYIQNRYQPVQINNCTIANNSTPGFVCRILAGADLRNVIFHNQGSGSELSMKNYLSVNDTAYPISISNSLFRSDTISCSRPELLTLTDNIMGANPMFLGTVDSSLNVSQPEYYQLSASSPCIDSGTPDTEGLNLPPMDLAGNYRIANGRIDMGCFEYGSKPYVDVDDPQLPPPPQGINLSLYPNPFLNSSSATGVFVEFTLPKKPVSQPVIKIFNIRGQLVKTIKLTESYNSLVSKVGLSGEVEQNGEFYSTIWNGRDNNNRPLASGTYIVKVTSGQQVSSKKVTLVR